MVDSLIDPKLEEDLKKTKNITLETLQVEKIFLHTFATMRPKERAQTIQKIQTAHKKIEDFLASAKKYDLRAPALKFGMENIRQNFQLVMSLWRRISSLIDTTAGAGAAPKQAPHGAQSETNAAVQKYSEALKSLGRNATSKDLADFKSKIEQAYEKAKEKAGGRDLNVHIALDGDKIKVKMEPK
jgi:hypothetical protein